MHYLWPKCNGHKPLVLTTCTLGGHAFSTYAARGGGGVFKLRTAEYRGGGGVWAMSMYAKLMLLEAILSMEIC